MTLFFVGNDCLAYLDSGKSSSFSLGLRKMLLKEGILKRQGGKSFTAILQRTFLKWVEVVIEDIPADS